MQRIDWMLVRYDLEKLVPHERNPRQLSKEQHAQLTKSLTKFGTVEKPVVNTDGSIIGGHQRIKVLQELAFKTVECWVPSRKLTQKEVDELNIRLNKNTGEWDWDTLANEWDANDLMEWGFTDEDLQMFENEDTEAVDEDDSQSLEPCKDEDATTKLGDIYDLGLHRIACGDSTDSDIVSALLRQEKPILMVTDPPYGFEYDATWRHKIGRKDCKYKHAKGKVINDNIYEWIDSYKLFQGDVAYIWHPALYTHIFSKNIIECGFKIIYQIIWVKHAGFGMGDYHWYHEPCIVAVKNGKNHNWQGSRKERTVWEIQSRTALGNTKQMEEYTGHSTQKPLECMARPIRNNSAAGESVYDPFLGSGTTLIAAEQLGRICYGIEISAAYCDVIIRRYQNYMKKQGKPYEIKRNGEPFEMPEASHE